MRRTATLAPTLRKFDLLSVCGSVNNKRTALRKCMTGSAGLGLLSTTLDAANERATCQVFRAAAFLNSPKFQELGTRSGIVDAGV